MNATDSQSASQGRRRPWTLISLALLAAVVLVYLVVIGGLRLRPQGTQGPAIGRRLPYLQLEPLTGDSQSVSLDDLRGRVTLVNFWGTWCPPCRLEFPEIVELAARFGKQDDFRLYAVSCGQGNDEGLDTLHSETLEFLDASKVTLPTYADQNAASRRALDIALDLGGFAYPTTLVLDRQGTIRGFWVGYGSRSAREMAALIQELLQAPPDEPAP